MRSARCLAAQVDAAGAEERDAGPFALLDPADRAVLPAGLADAYPLAHLQSGMLFHTELRPETAVYHDVFSAWVRAPFDPARLRAEIQRAAARHPVLRTSFALSGYREPLQLVHRAVEVPFAVDDLRSPAGGGAGAGGARLAGGRAPPRLRLEPAAARAFPRPPPDHRLVPAHPLVPSLGARRLERGLAPGRPVPRLPGPPGRSGGGAAGRRVPRVRPPRAVRDRVRGGAGGLAGISSKTSSRASCRGGPWFRRGAIPGTSSSPFPTRPPPACAPWPAPWALRSRARSSRRTSPCWRAGPAGPISSPAW